MLSMVRRLTVLLCFVAGTQPHAAQVDAIYFTSQGREVQVIYGNTFENPSFVSFAYSCAPAEPCESSTIATQVYRDFIDANLRGRFYTYSLKPSCQAPDPNQCAAPLSVLGEGLSETASTPVAHANDDLAQVQQAATFYPIALAAGVEHGVNQSLDFVAEVGRRAQTQLPALANPLHIVTRVGSDGSAQTINLCQVKGATCEVPQEFMKSLNIRIKGDLAAITINVADLLAFDTGTSMLVQALGIVQNAGKGGGECKRETATHSKGGDNLTITCYLNLP